MGVSTSRKPWASKKRRTASVALFLASRIVREGT